VRSFFFSFVLMWAKEGFHGGNGGGFSIDAFAFVNFVVRYMDYWLRLPVYFQIRIRLSHGGAPS